jgi:hypothetical protein
VTDLIKEVHHEQPDDFVQALLPGASWIMDRSFPPMPQ